MCKLCDAIRVIVCSVTLNKNKNIGIVIDWEKEKESGSYNKRNCIFWMNVNNRSSDTCYPSNIYKHTIHPKRIKQNQRNRNQWAIPIQERERGSDIRCENSAKQNCCRCFSSKHLLLLRAVIVSVNHWKTLCTHLSTKYDFILLLLPSGLSSVLHKSALANILIAK